MARVCKCNKRRYNKNCNKCGMEIIPLLASVEEEAKDLIEIKKLLYYLKL